ncbi:hypothetical protein ACFPM7_29205, partial [Actinokineospora guangxiensis]
MADGEGVTGAGSHMTTELPAGLQKFFKVTLGMTWPEGSEGGLKAMSQAWLDFQDSAGLRAGEIEALIPRLNQAMQGVTADALADYLKEVGVGLREVETAAGEFAKMTKTAAADIQKGKIMLIAMAAMVLATVISLIASLFGAFAVPGALAAGRIALGEIWKAIVKKITQLTWQKAAEFAAKLTWTMGKYAAGGAAFMGGLDLSIQGIQIAFDGKDGVSGRDEIDWESIKGSVVGGAIGGAAFGAFHGIGKGIAGIGKNVKPPGWVRGVGQIGYAGGQMGMVAGSNPFVNMATGNDDEIWAGILGGASGYHGSKGMSARVDQAVGNFTKDVAGRFGMKFDTPTLPVDPEKQALLGDNDSSRSTSDGDSVYGDGDSIRSTSDGDSVFNEPLVIPDGPLETSGGYSGGGQPIGVGEGRFGSLFSGGQDGVRTTSDGTSGGTSGDGSPVVTESGGREGGRESGGQRGEGSEQRGTDSRGDSRGTDSRGTDSRGLDSRGTDSRGLDSRGDFDGTASRQGEGGFGQREGQIGSDSRITTDDSTQQHTNPWTANQTPTTVQGGPVPTQLGQGGLGGGMQSAPLGGNSTQSGPQAVQGGQNSQPPTQQSGLQTSTQPSTQIGQPNTQPGQLGTQSGQPNTQPGQLGTQSGQPGTQTGQPAQPGTQSGQPVTQSGQPNTQTGQSGQPGTQSGQPGTPTGQPGAQSGQPLNQSAQPSTQSGQPNSQQSNQSATGGGSKGAPVVTESGPQTTTGTRGQSLLDTPVPELRTPALADTHTSTPQPKPTLSIDTSVATRTTDPVSPLTPTDAQSRPTGPVSPISPVTPFPQTSTQTTPAPFTQTGAQPLPHQPGPLPAGHP